MRPSHIAAAIVLALGARVDAEPRRALVVLGAPARESGAPGPAMQRRLDLALALARADGKALVVVTGGAVANLQAEGPAMARWLAGHGVDRRRILVEDRARNTRENAALSTPLLVAAGVERVTVVTERYHLARGVHDLRTALGQAHASLEVDGAAAPDQLRPVERARLWGRERCKMLRDDAFARREGQPSGTRK